MNRIAATLAAAALVLAAELPAQQAKPPVRDSAKAVKTAPPANHHAGHHASQGHGNDHAASGWKELDSFHMVMQQAWHPVKDNGDVAPARSKASQLLASANTLAAAKAPKGCDTPELRSAAATIKKEAESFAKLVSSKAADKAIADAIKTLHDKFEVLEEGCKPSK